jgi:uncharacterized membrane protein
MMWPDYNDGWNWIWMAGMMLVFWTAIFLVVVWAARALARSRPGQEDAMATLRRRLASGQITPDEFESTRRILQA